MPRRSYPLPQERTAREYRAVRRYADREPSDHLGPGGYGGARGYRGAYADRPEYWMTRGELYPPRPEGSGWPSPLHAVPERADEIHLRAQRDRDLARSVDSALYQVLGREANHIAVYADDANVTLEGELIDHPTARQALEVALRVPGVRRVRDRLCWWR